MANMNQFKTEAKPTHARAAAVNKFRIDAEKFLSAVKLTVKPGFHLTAFAREFETAMVRLNTAISLDGVIGDFDSEDT